MYAKKAKRVLQSTKIIFKPFVFKIACPALSRGTRRACREHFQVCFVVKRKKSRRNATISPATASKSGLKVNL